MDTRTGCLHDMEHLAKVYGGKQNIPKHYTELTEEQHKELAPLTPGERKARWEAIQAELNKPEPRKKPTAKAKAKAKKARKTAKKARKQKKGK